MDEKYRLIFRGELLDGQHRAVVKRRLTELLKLKDDQVGKLFSGQPVVLKRSVDRETAARYQALFKKAGGRLRVESSGFANDSASTSAGSAASAGSAPSAESARASGPQAVASAAEAAFQPPLIGRPAAATDIDAPDFKVQSTWFAPPAEPSAEIEAPDYSVAAVGSDLAEKSDTPAAVVADVAFDLAEVGADLLVERRETPRVELDSLDFEIAEVGADIGPARKSDEAAAPDVSHIALQES